MNFIGIDTTVEFFIEFYWYRYRNGIFYMKFIGIDTTVKFFTEFYWYRYRNGIFYVNVIGIDTTMTFFTEGGCIFVPQTGFAEIYFSTIFSPIHRKKGDISFGRTNLQLRRSSII